MQSMHVYEVRPRKDHRCVNLISGSLPFGRLWYGEPDVRGAATPKNDRPKRLPQAYVDEFQAIGEDPRRFAAFVNARVRKTGAP